MPAYLRGVVPILHRPFLHRHQYLYNPPGNDGVDVVLMGGMGELGMYFVLGHLAFVVALCHIVFVVVVMCLVAVVGMSLVGMCFVVVVTDLRYPVLECLMCLLSLWLSLHQNCLHDQFGDCLNVEKLLPLLLIQQ